jgi:hypothetical protein
VKRIKIHSFQPTKEGFDRYLQWTKRSYTIDARKGLTPAKNIGCAFILSTPESSNMSLAVCRWSFAMVANSKTASEMPEAAPPILKTSSWLTLCFAVISAGITIRRFDA